MWRNFSISRWVKKLVMQHDTKAKLIEATPGDEPQSYNCTPFHVPLGTVEVTLCTTIF